MIMNYCANLDGINFTDINGNNTQWLPSIIKVIPKNKGLKDLIDKIKKGEYVV